jgi:hypothetical protein
MALYPRRQDFSISLLFIGSVMETIVSVINENREEREKQNSYVAFRNVAYLTV